jgi:putative endonuclease
MFYVYIIRSISNKDQIYIGASENLKQRIADHNNGKSPHTAKFTPWELERYSAFPDKLTAYNFESYLKSHSGRAFAKKRLMRSGPLQASLRLAALGGTEQKFKVPPRRRSSLA